MEMNHSQKLVATALELGPMTIPQIAKARHLPINTVRRIVNGLGRKVIRYRIHVRHGRMGAPAYYHELRA